MSGLSGKRVIVLGAGGSGLSAARLAFREGASVRIVDSVDSGVLRERTSELSGLGIEVSLGWQVPAVAESYDLCIFSPGVALASAMGSYYRSHSVSCVSELEFGGRYCHCLKLGVTGTNGKTTVVEMLTHCLSRCGKRVIAGGNIGLPLSAIALSAEVYDIIVVEVSSYQLESTGSFETAGSVLLNVTPDHLSRHGSMELYRDTKLRLLRQVAEGGVCVLRCDLWSDSRVREACGSHEVMTFGLGCCGESRYRVRDGYICRRDGSGFYEHVLSLSDLPYGGDHNYENCMAVMALAECVGVRPGDVACHLRTFQIGRHRMEVVWEHDGLRYVNDSKATNVDALIQSLRCFGSPERKIWLIAGGVTKGCDLSSALPYMRGVVSEVYVIGESREALSALWGGEVPCVTCSSMEEAFERACGSAKGPGTVLLSPGCASQDMFRDYEARGDCFVELVSRLRALNLENTER